MVPAQFRLVDTLPLTANGKVDYSALQRDSGRPSAAPSGDAPRSEDASVASADPRGQQLLEDIRDILQLEKVDTAESLVALGGSSIEIVRLSNRALAYTDGRLKLEDYFQAESVDALLAALKDEPQKDEPREPVMASPARRDLAARSAPRGDLVASFPHASVGLRTDVQGTPAVQLIRGPDQDRSLWDTRRSHRQYALRPVGFQTVSQWLRPLASVRADHITRYRYASAGGLYPVQVYLHVKRGRVSGLLGGDYYYHPEQHRLFEVNRGAGLDRDVYGDRNRPIYDQAAFCVFLVCPLDTIEASYGEWAYDLAMYEAGSIGQLLRDAAPPLGIGVCSIGTLDFARVRTRFGVDERHLLLHSFVCGAIGEGVGESAESRAPVSELDRATLLLRRIDALGDDDSQYLDSCMLEGAR
jgi:SagB-type dehydrogenase family enzyme